MKSARPHRRTSDTEQRHHRTGTTPAWAPASPFQWPTLCTLKITARITCSSNHKPKREWCGDFNCNLILPIFLTKRFTNERQTVFCTSRSCDKNKVMIGSRKSSGKDVFTATYNSVAMTNLNDGWFAVNYAITQEIAIPFFLNIRISTAICMQNMMFTWIYNKQRHYMNCMVCLN